MYLCRIVRDKNKSIEQFYEKHNVFNAESAVQ